MAGDPSGIPWWRRTVAHAFTHTTVPSQAFASLTALTSTILVARSVSAEEFAPFATAQLIVMLVVGIHRAAVLMPVMVTPGTDRHPLIDVRSRSMAIAVTLTAAGLLAGLLTPSGPARSLLLIVSFLLLPSMYWDTARAYFQGARAYTAQSKGEATALVCTLSVGIIGAVMGLGIWTFVAGAALGQIAAGLVTLPPLSRRWAPWGRKWPVRTSRNLLFDYLIYTGLDQVIVLAAGSFLTLAAVGAIRLAQTTLGPVTVLLLAMEMLAFPRARDSPDPVPRKARRLLVMFAPISAAALVLAVLLVALPTQIGSGIFGETWASSAAILVPLAIRQAASAVIQAPTIALVTSGRSATVLACRLSTAPFLLGGSLATLLTGSTTLFVWTFAGLHSISAAILWITALNTRSHKSEVPSDVG
ncbi:MAG: hypothetical protein OJJ54_03610 [Pseudonocardia sp.]|nr:hypothetical protein [Pseudonocardia sp.]